VFDVVVVGTNIVETNILSDYVVPRNFDPQSLNASPYVNGILYSGIAEYFVSGDAIIVPIAVDPLADTYSAVADDDVTTGGFFTGLTRDDVGGLAYLLSTNNINYETLLPGICGVGVNSNSFVNGAWRPGVEKITFIPQPVDSQSGAFLPTTNCYTDSFITNGVLAQQQLIRVVSQPDFLFSAGDVTDGNPDVSSYSRIGTTNWLNNATANGNTNGAGPGVIQPQVQFIFNKLGRLLYTSGNLTINDQSEYWASFDGSTNTPVVYPAPKIGTNQMTVRMWLVLGNHVSNHFAISSQNSFDWSPVSTFGTPFAFQISTNLSNWVTILTVTNNGSVSTYLNYAPSSTSGFYRLVQQ